MIKLQGQTPFGEVSHGGVRFRADRNGVLELAEGNEAFAKVLCDTHGFRPFKAEAPERAAKKEAAPAGGEPQGLDVDAASRDELKEFLRARGVVFAGNASNDLLRQMVRTELGQGGSDAGSQ